MIPAAALSHYDQSGLSGGSQAANNFLRNVRAFHATQHKQEHGMPSTNEMVRELGKCSAAPKNRDAYAREFADALERDHAHKRGHLKLIARTAEVAPATVKNWKAGRHVPGIDVFFRLLPKSPSLQAMCANVIAMESELSPEFQKELAVLIQRHIR